MKKKITNPVWGNEEKTIVLCDFEYEDNSISSASVSNTEGGNPDWKEIFDTYKKKDIGKFVERHRQNNQPPPIDIEKELNEILFRSKLEAFEIEEVKNSKNRTLKSKIRKGKSLTEVYAYTAALLSIELKS